MKSNYERQQYRIKYCIITIVFLLCFILWCLFGKEVCRDTRFIMGCILLIVIYAIVIFWYSYRVLGAVYQDIENVSNIMLEVMEQDVEPPAEELKEGTVGILYSNFYKMVNALKDSKNREIQEKIFLRDIISDISHQLKTPLASLNVFVDLLVEDKVTEPTQQKQILTEAGNQLTRMEWMVLSMLKLARIEAGAIQFDKTETLLKPIFMQAVESVQYLIREREQDLHIACADDASAQLDGGWLTEGLINLLKNASDYAGVGKSIWLELEQNNVYTRISVKDNGPGIVSEEVPHIFKRFYRVHQEVNPNSVGIGLSLTKSIVEGMGGTIKVDSKTKQEEEESFTTFVLTFVK